jgi:hypothetical protein
MQIILFAYSWIFMIFPKISIYIHKIVTFIYPEILFIYFFKFESLNIKVKYFWTLWAFFELSMLFG